MTPKRDKARLEVRCEWEQIEAWQEVADAEYTTLSQWIRRLADQAVAKFRKQKERER